MNALIISNIVLWFVVLALLVALLAVIRQLGVLHERIAPTGALMLAKGLKVGEGAPQVPVHDLEGAPCNIGEPSSNGRATLLMFVSPTCPVCKSLLPVLKSSLTAERDWLDIVLASDGDLNSQREFVRSHKLGGMPYVVSTPLGITYQVSRLPFAVLIDAQGILRARGIVNSREHLESIFEAKRLGFGTIQAYFESIARHEAA
jgi:methylamine dehydrogenase accessory protein MauD